MTIKATVTEDTITEYLNQLSSTFENRKEHILREMMYSATGYPGDENAPIARKLMKEGSSGAKDYQYNPWLFKSGQDKNYWSYESDGDVFTILANYSGMRGYESNEDFKVWAEFSEEWEEDEPYVAMNMDPYERTLARDYAFYQETGADKYASPKDARHIGFVNRGMGDAAKKQIPETLARQYQIILDGL